MNWEALAVAVAVSVLAVAVIRIYPYVVIWYRRRRLRKTLRRVINKQLIPTDKPIPSAEFRQPVPALPPMRSFPKPVPKPVKQKSDDPWDDDEPTSFYIPEDKP